MSESAVVCGFSDPAAEIAGLAWSLDGAEGGLLLAAGEVHAAAARITPADGGTEMSLESPLVSCEARLEARAAADLPGAQAATASASFELTRGSASGAGEADGHLTHWATDPAAGASVLRHLALPGRDGSVLLVISTRPEGGTELADELTTAWLLHPEGDAVGFGEALLSTEYDGPGRPTRAGLELWPEDPDGPPARAAGARLGGVEEDRVAAALLASSVEGASGLGSYLLWRA
jgi:hypothetical protein